MNPVSDFLSSLVRSLFRLLLWVAAGVFLLSFLLAALVVVAGVTLWSLITGRKPAPVVLFGRLREQSQRYAQGVWPNQGSAADVVDVDATEVREGSSIDPRLDRLR